MREAVIQSDIRLALADRCVLFRNQTGVYRVGERTMRSGLTPGGSDLIGWTTVNGVAVFTAIEVKTERGRATETQRRFIDAVNGSGGIAFVARSASQAVVGSSHRVPVAWQHQARSHRESIDEKANPVTYDRHVAFRTGLPRGPVQAKNICEGSATCTACAAPGSLVARSGALGDA